MNNGLVFCPPCKKLFNHFCNICFVITFSLCVYFSCKLGGKGLTKDATLGPHMRWGAESLRLLESVKKDFVVNSELLFLSFPKLIKVTSHQQISTIHYSNVSVHFAIVAWTQPSRERKKANLFGCWMSARSLIRQACWLFTHWLDFPGCSAHHAQKRESAIYNKRRPVHGQKKKWWKKLFSLH